MGIVYAVNSEFFSKLNPISAYVLGFFFADGSMHISERGKYVVITSTDKIIIVCIKKWMQSRHIIKIRKPLFNRRTRYVLKIGNKYLYNSLLQYGLHPHKSLTVKMPPIEHNLRDFVRGYFDGDGCVYFEKSKGIKQKTIIRRLAVIFTSGSKEFLDKLLSILKSNMSLRQDKIYKSHRSFQLRFTTDDSVELFKFMYHHAPKGVFFSRKYKIFEEYFEWRPQRIDSSVRSVLQWVNGHVVK